VALNGCSCGCTIVHSPLNMDFIDRHGMYQAPNTYLQNYIFTIIVYDMC